MLSSKCRQLFIKNAKIWRLFSLRNKNKNKSRNLALKSGNAGDQSNWFNSADVDLQEVGKIVVHRVKKMKINSYIPCNIASSCSKMLKASWLTSKIFFSTFVLGNFDFPLPCSRCIGTNTENCVIATFTCINNHCIKLLSKFCYESYTLQLCTYCDIQS